MCLKIKENKFVHLIFSIGFFKRLKNIFAQYVIYYLEKYMWKIMVYNIILFVEIQRVD